MRRFLLPALTLAILLPLISCSKDQPTGPTIVIPGPGDSIVYSKHIEPIFKKSCGGSGCHLNGENAAELSLDTWDEVMKGTEDAVVVVPYSPQHSDLFSHVNTDTTLGSIMTPHMPGDHDTLPREQMLTIRRWIAEGAKNDAGEVALAGLDRPRIFVTAQAEDKITAIDLQTERTMRYITVGSRPDESTPLEAPHNLALSPDGRYLYVNLIAAGMIEKYDAHSFQKLGQAAVGLSPAQIVVTRDGSTLYVSNFDISLKQRFINRVDAASFTVTDTIDQPGQAPHGLTLSKDEHFLYTMNARTDDISEIDLTSPDFEVTNRIPIVPGSPKLPNDPVKYEPYQSVLSADGKLMFVSCRTSGEIRVVDLTAHRVIDSIKVGTAPQILAITPNGEEIWVPNRGSNDVSIINVATRKVVYTIPNFVQGPHAIDFTADGKTAYLSCENTTGSAHHPTVGSRIPGKFYVIDVAARTGRNVFDIGSFAAGIAVQR
jgi:YVTN family beta-propeller protein